MEGSNKQEWTDPRPQESPSFDPIAGGGEDPEDVDTEENAREVREGDDD